MNQVEVLRVKLQALKADILLMHGETMHDEDILVDMLVLLDRVEKLSCAVVTI